MQRVHIDQQHVAIAVNQFYRFILLAVLNRLDQPAEPPDTVVDMYDVIADLQAVQFGNREAFVTGDLAAQLVTVVTVENLMVGIAAHLEPRADKTFVKRHRQRLETYRSGTRLMEYVLQAFDLGLVFRKDADRIPVGSPRRNIIGQHAEVLVEGRLRRGSEIQFDHIRAFRRCSPAPKHRIPCDLIHETASRHHTAVNFGTFDAVGQQPDPNVVHTTHGIRRIIDPIGHLLACKSRERDP